MSDKHDLHHRRGSGCQYCKAREERMRELEDLDLRWRPMRTAPRDGTVVELREGGHAINGRRHGKSWFNVQGKWLDPAAWRPAHPDWNEKEEADNG